MYKILTIAVFCLSSNLSVAFAQSKVCSTVVECQELRKSIDERIKELLPSFLDVAKKTDGSIEYMTQSEANRYCKELGARLPTARELVQLLMRDGAKGVVNSCHGETQCQRIRGFVNPNGESDEFSFSWEGYRNSIRLSSEVSDRWARSVWSASTAKGVSGHGIYLNMDTLFEVNHIENYLPVRCLKLK